MSESLDALERVFGHTEFRPGQSEVVDSIMAGHPTLAVMPTGAGKSLCYQLPAVVLDGLTLVISPLIALIHDQVRALVAKNVAAASLTSSDSYEDRQETLRRLQAGQLDILYVAPERFRNPGFLKHIQQAKLALFVVDEAHCISQWGHDFRPDYARLGDVIQRLAPPRVAALTATATVDVQDNILSQLGLHEPRKIITGFDRPNLELSVKETARGKAKLEATKNALETWTQDGGAAIIYVATRKKTEEIATALSELGFDAHAYHAGLDAQVRNRVQEHFTTGPQPVVVATTAFGMGIDRADVRVVVHYQIPASVEGYYQEVGRGGRDGAAAGGILLYDSSDLRYAYMKHQASCPSPEAVAQAFTMVNQQAAAPHNFEQWVEYLEPEVGPATRAALIALEQAGDVAFTGSGAKCFVQQSTVDPEMLQERARRERARLDAMIGYVMRAPCRRRYLVDYFGDLRRPERCEVCDRCLAPDAVVLEGEARNHALMALSCVARMRGRYGKTRVADVLLGSRARPIIEAGLTELSTHGLLKGWTRPDILALLDALARAELAKVTGQEYPKLMLSDQGAAALKGAPIALQLKMERGSPSKTSKTGASRSPAPTVEEGAQPLFDALRSWRSSVAQELGKPPYVVAHDKLLAELSNRRPETLQVLATLPGIGPSKLEKYGAAILKIVVAHPA